MAWDTTKTAGDIIRSDDYNEQVSWLKERHKNYSSGTPTTFTLTQDNGGVERKFFKDDFSNNTIANYTVTGAPTIAAGVLTMAWSEKITKDIDPTSTIGTWSGVVKFNTPIGATYSQYAQLYFGARSFLRISRAPVSGDITVRIYIENALVKVSSTLAAITDGTYVSFAVYYNGTQYQMYWNGVAQNTPYVGVAPITPTVGCMSTGGGEITNSITFNEITYTPSVAFTDLYGSDTETRYMQLTSTDITQPSPTGTWVAASAGDVVVSGGYMTLSSNDDDAVAVALRSYNFASGEIEFSLDNNNDGGGGVDSTGLLFCYQDILNHYKLVIEDDAAGAENLKFYKVVAGTATQLGTTKDISATYTRGNKTWLKVQYSRETGQMWAYLRDDAAVYPTTPDIADAFSAQFSYGKVGYWAAVTTLGAGNLSVRFDDLVVRANLLIGETNVPATDSGFYLRDEGAVDSSGRYVTTGTWTVSGGLINCTSAGNLTMPIQTTIGVHSFIPTLANGTDYYYFGGYRVQFVASGGNTCAVTLQTTAGAAQGSGTITVSTTAGLFAAPIIITEAATSITVTVAGASGSLTPGTTASTNASPKFTVGTATCSFDNYTFSGTRYYNKPMLRGAQIGEYYNGAATVQATRVTSDGGWNQIAEFTVGASASAYDTTNGWLTLADATAIYPTGVSLGQGHYAFQLKRSTGATDVFNCNIAGNAITTTAGGVTTIGGTAYTGTTLTSPVWLEFVATGTQIAVYSNGVLIGTKTGLTLTPGTIQLSRTTANIYVYAMNFNALESTSTNGIAATLGGVPHGARYDTQEEVYYTWTNAAKYGEHVLAVTAKTTATPQTFELTYKNSTDTTSISNDGTLVADVVLNSTTYADSMVPLIFRFQDRADTIRISARRKNYSGITYDNTPAKFIETLAVTPLWEE